MQIAGGGDRSLVRVKGYGDQGGVGRGLEEACRKGHSLNVLFVVSRAKGPTPSGRRKERQLPFKRHRPCLSEYRKCQFHTVMF